MSDENLLTFARDLDARTKNFEKRFTAARPKWTDEKTEAELLKFGPLENAIISERATSIAGLVAKARSIQCIRCFDLTIPEGDSQDERLAWSIVRDILAVGDSGAYLMESE